MANEQDPCEPLQPLRERAHVVCTECHARKVKCDLQEKPNGPCRNCRRSGSACVRRDGVRKRRKTARPASVVAPGCPSPPHSARSSGTAVPGTAGGIPPSSPLGLPRHDRPRQRGRATATAVGQAPDRPADGFISRTAVMSYAATGENSPSPGSRQSWEVRASILKLTKADVLPRPVLLQALTDAYFQHVHPLIPVVDRSDLSGPDASLLLKQAVCLAGGLVQHGLDTEDFCGMQYDKIKTLVYMNHETDHLTVLKALCLTACYSPVSSDQVTMDGPWQWLGMGIRLAIQMGLHKSATYDGHPRAQSLRRVFWHLVNGDRLASSCWGRPTALRLAQYDVPPLSDGDFPAAGRHVAVSVQSIRLTEIIGIVAEMNLQQGQKQPEEVDKLVARLCQWLHDVPDEVRLYDAASNRLPYHPATSVLHILYFAVVILLEMLKVESTAGRWSPSLPSLVAASCMARLYDEVACREETPRLLHYHGFLCMVAAVPLVCYRRESGEREPFQADELGVIRAVLECMSPRYGGCDLVLRKVTRLQQDVDRARNPRSRQASCETRRTSGDALWGRLPALFPFPEAFCPGMELLARNLGSVDEELLDLPFQPATDEFADTYFNFADMILTGCDDFSLEFPEAGSVLLGGT